MIKNKNIFDVTNIDRECYTFNTPNEFTFHIWRNSTTAYHKHDNYVEIFILLKGYITNTMLNETRTLSPGDIGIVFPNIPHIHQSINNDEVQLLNVTCHIATAETIFSNIYHRQPPSAFIRPLQKNELKMVKNFRDLIIFANNEPEYNTLLSSFITYLLGILSTGHVDNQIMPEPFQNFINALQEMDLEFVKISDLYKISGYPQRTLSNYFQKYMNQTLVQYVNSLKLNHAKNLLRSTDLPITEICTKIGFDSIAHFNHLFKDAFGISPKEYRLSPNN